MKRTKREIHFEVSKFIKFGDIIAYCLLLFVEILITVNNWKAVHFAGIPSWYAVLPTVIFLAAENAVKIWALHTFQSRIACYVLDTLALLVLTIFTDGTLISTLYMVILSEFYLSQKNLAGNVAMAATSIGLFLIAFAVSHSLKGEAVSVAVLVSSAFNDIILLTLHFFIFNLTIQTIRKNREITRALEELNETNEKLRVAYRELQEVTALEERQRIAKDIHDTAGHSITTVIMQTEAAKLIIDSDPASAKRKIAAANLQAKNALEELRESVHLLSGTKELLSLKEMLLGIIHDSTDGTDIVVRYDIDDVRLCDAKRRFVCNSLKEGISNGLRHGGATAFWFELKAENGRVNFLLSDNGAGMDISALKEGFGLTGMHARAESLGGNVWFDTESGEGFEIHITLPMDGEEGKHEN